jgi:hypothetical protein
MARAKLTAMASEWVKKGTGRPKVRPKTEKHPLTVYLSKKASRLLWERRVETGIPLSRTIEDLVVRELSGNKSKTLVNQQ